MPELRILGRAATQGSVRAIIPKHGTRPIVLHDQPAKLKAWRNDVREVVQRALDAEGTVAIGGALCIRVRFYLHPPKKMPKGRIAPEVKPDLDKLIRSLLDALTGVLYIDDAQVVVIDAAKLYGFPERTELNWAVFGQPELSWFGQQEISEGDERGDPQEGQEAEEKARQKVG